jgi:hypothetical protein
VVASWQSGTVAPGATQHWYWNNANLTAAYHVGLSPFGGNLYSHCMFEVTRTWEAQKYGGEREFHFYIKNISNLSCGTNILLAWKPRSSTRETGGIEPGWSRGFTWIVPTTGDRAAYFVGVSPSGATSSNPCQLEVTPTYYFRNSSELQLWIGVKNVGTIACQGAIQLAATTSAHTSVSIPTLDSGVSQTWDLLADPADRVLVPGVDPLRGALSG